MKIPQVETKQVRKQKLQWIEDRFALLQFLNGYFFSFFISNFFDFNVFDNN